MVLANQTHTIRQDSLIDNAQIQAETETETETETERERDASDIAARANAGRRRP